VVLLLSCGCNIICCCRLKSTNAWSKPIALATRRSLGAWRLTIAAVECVLRVIVSCRVVGGNDAAAIRVGRRDDRKPWLTLFCSRLDRGKRAAGILSYPAVSYLLGVDRNR